MCGIVGRVGPSVSAERVIAEIETMCDAIRHRGPDDGGSFAVDGAALGMRRLSIIDVAGGHQPIANEDGTIHIVFNGEIYNYREIRDRLLKSGHDFQTHTDTETILHLYEECGERVVDHLRGMFAFAIWDSRRQALLLARDRLGIKPLYYAPTADGVVFASELKALLRLPDCPQEIDLEAMAEYLSLGYVPEPRSIFLGIRKLEPGQLLTWTREAGARVHTYWTPFRQENSSLDEQQAMEEVRRLLTEAVRYRLIADVPLGAFLSGGLDSSAVVAEMSRQMSTPVRTFSIGFREPEFNEAPHAARVARELGTDHTELILEPDVESLFEQIIQAFDEPFADSSAIPTLLVSRLARTRVKVALSGDGGDEVFGGYTRYADFARRGNLQAAPGMKLLGAVARRLPHATLGRNRLLELTRTPLGRYAGMVAHPLHPSEGGVAAREVAAAGRDLDTILLPWISRVPGRDPVTTASFVDLLSYLPGDILTKVDRMSMAVSLEARVPLLDHHLVEFATSLPGHLRFRDGSGKWIFRNAVRDLVPATVLDKPKQGFGVPLRNWFRKELRHHVEGMKSPTAAMYEYVDWSAASRIFQEHQRGRRDHSALIWKLLVLQGWLTSRSSAGGAPPRSSDMRLAATAATR